MARPTTGITPDSPAGRVLLALRAGPMTSGELDERIPGFNRETRFLVTRGLVVRPKGLKGGYWTITDAGSAACPLRNPLAAKVTPPPTGAALGRRLVDDTPCTTASVPMRPTQEKEAPMKNPWKQINANGGGTAATTAPEAITRAISGVPCEMPITCEALVTRAITLGAEHERHTLINIVRKMAAEGDVVGAIGATAARRYFDPRTEAGASAGPAVASPTVAEPPAEHVDPSPAPPAATGAEADPAPIEYALYSDGRLAIIDGDEILVLPCADTLRLARFLGCFEFAATTHQPLAA